MYFIITLLAVIFDLGGVVFDSPLEGIRKYERENNLPKFFIGRVIVSGGSMSAYLRLERGEINAAEFYSLFEQECAAAGIKFTFCFFFSFSEHTTL